MSTGTETQKPAEVNYQSLEQAAAAGDFDRLLKMAVATREESKETRMLAQMNMGPDGLECQNSAQLWWLSGIYFKSEVAPKDDTDVKLNGQWYKRTEQQVRSRLFIKMTFGAELGMKPLQSLQNIAIINNRPTIWGDAAKALVLQSGLAEYIYEREVGKVGNPKNPNDDWGFECVTKRKGQAEEVYGFTWGDAKIAGLLDKNQSLYKLYPKRMLMFRARGFRLRDTYPDVLKGLITAEEARDIDSERNTGSTNAINNKERLERLLSGDEDTGEPLKEAPEQETDKEPPFDPPTPEQVAKVEAGEPVNQRTNDDFDAVEWANQFIAQIEHTTRAKARREATDVLTATIEKLGPAQYERCYKACQAANWILD